MNVDILKTILKIGKERDAKDQTKLSAKTDDTNKSNAEQNTPSTSQNPMFDMFAVSNFYNRNKILRNLQMVYFIMYFISGSGKGASERTLIDVLSIKWSWSAPISVFQGRELNPIEDNVI